jgi:hypothetical protein
VAYRLFIGKHAGILTHLRTKVNKKAPFLSHEKAQKPRKKD